METCVDNINSEDGCVSSENSNNNVSKESSSGGIVDRSNPGQFQQQIVQLTCSSLPRYRSESNLSETNLSDTVSESSDNATLLSLSRDDLLALGAGSVREDVRVSRKRLETLILRGQLFFVY